MEESRARRETPWIFWPFVAIWGLAAWVLRLIGRLLAMIIGLVLLVVGLILTSTVAGAIIGIPLMVFGLMLIARGMF